MPLVRIEIVKGKDTVYKKALLDAVHTALVRALGIPEWDRFQRLVEIEDECFERGQGKTDRFTMIEITLFPGRTREQKARVYEEITKELEKRPGISPSDVFIVLREPPDENWGLGGHQRQG